MKKVLIVEDEQRMREILFKWLKVGGLDVIAAANAEEATDILIRERIDLVLLDIKMPTVDGKYFFEVIQEYDPQIKVIVTSVYPVDIQQELIPKAEAYFDKSQGPIVLIEKITNKLL